MEPGSCGDVTFSEASKARALKFLAEFTSAEVLPAPEDPLPIRPNWPQLEEAEMEAECLDMSRRYLSSKQCPGLLSYHLAAEASRRLKGMPPDTFRAPPPDGSLPGGGPSEDGQPEETEGGEEQSKLLSGIEVARQLLTTIFTVCKEWLLQFPSLSAPAHNIEISMFGIKNTRRKMEDRYALCLDVNSLYGLQGMPCQSYYAVCDGHNGEAAAVYASVHLLTNIVRHSAFRTDLAAAIKGGIRTTDDSFCKKAVRSGTTVVLTFVRGDKLYAGWLGDSQALLVRQGVPLPLVDPHKPEREDEQKRIEEAGGMVIFVGAWRVNGNLSVSRAIGDAKDKQFVIGEADVSTFDLDRTEDYMVVACDGLWDVLNGDEVVQCVKSHLDKPEGSKQTVAQALVNLAKSEGSGDNITAIVVFFKGFGDAPPPPKATESCDDPCTKSCDHQPGEG